MSAVPLYTRLEYATTYALNENRTRVYAVEPHLSSLSVTKHPHETISLNLGRQRILGLREGEGLTSLVLNFWGWLGYRSEFKCRVGQPTP